MNLVMKKTSLFLLFLLAGSYTFCQSDDNISLDFYGYIRADAYRDTYKGYDLGQDIFYLLPNHTLFQGVDVNKQKSSNISAMASRLGVRIKGPDFMGAKLSGTMELDFCGNMKNVTSVFRIRHAYSSLTWKQSQLVFGQTWHPFCSSDHLPFVAGLNTGAPFHAFNFSPMIRYNFLLGNFILGFSLVSENQFVTSAAEPSAYLNSNNHAKRNGTLPEIVVTGDFNINGFLFLGAGAEYQRIKPRLTITNEAGVISSTNSFLASTALMGYLRIKSDAFSAMAKCYYGENLSHLLIPGGYGVASYDVASGIETYTCYKTFTAVFNALYGRDLQFGLFAGYGKNLGTGTPLNDFGNGTFKVYGLYTEVRDMMRFAPQIAYQYGKTRFVTELETTIASFGNGAIQAMNGLPVSAHTATNNRLLLTISHSF
jgi:hypothetical protein